MKKEKTMIKFEEHYGMLFSMLNKPVPLTPDSKLPCLTRLIQDDSPMGRYVKQCLGHDEVFMSRKYAIDGINADMAAKVGFARDTPVSIHMFEIIGIFVEEGSKDWALHQMMHGEKIYYKFPSIVYCKHASKIMREVRCGCVDYMSIDAWLNGADKSGWQIYAEPKPESEYKVGDWVEIESSHTKGKTFVSVIKEMPNQEHHTIHVNSFCGGYYGIMESQIVRKLKPSEVVVKIGCLSGTVKKSCDCAYFSMRHSSPEMDRNYSVIKFSALDKETRELVESLLKAQDEE